MTPPKPDPWCETLAGNVVGKYKLISFVGAGKIGYVYRGQHIELDNCVRAVKFVFDALREGWQNELEKVTQLSLVEGIVQFHEHGTHRFGTRFCEYTVWDYIPPGENLSAYLRRVGRVQASFLMAVIERILRVLHGCKHYGVAHHGDLHSGNILIGDTSLANLDDSLQQREAIYVSDFGYGATGAAKAPKDDYAGLARIINDVLARVDYSKTTATDKQTLRAIQADLGKLLREPDVAARQQPLELLRLLIEIKRKSQADESPATLPAEPRDPLSVKAVEISNIGQFQVSEMIGERWEWWRKLFVSTVPARSKILALDIPTVVTGPRGCGKTMLFRRISERLIVECGPVDDLPAGQHFVGLYINANDFADAFAQFPESPRPEDAARLTCYANLCVLADILTVQSARAGRLGESATHDFLSLIEGWLLRKEQTTLVVGQDRLERCRTALEEIKWAFPSNADSAFPGYSYFSQPRWLPRLLQQVRPTCPWIGSRPVLILVDDFSTPRVSVSMQRVLNRLFLQRSDEFLAKVATEAGTTFVAEDSSGKGLQDGDDYQLVDMGEESLFLPEEERVAFLNELFSRRLAADARVPEGTASLQSLLGFMPLSKTEFARKLRSVIRDGGVAEKAPVPSGSQRRGRSRPRTLYYGENVFCDLWSGDTRTMIQLLTDVLDQAPLAKGVSLFDVPVQAEIQDRVLRTRGGEWLESHTRNEPTDPQSVRRDTEVLRQQDATYKLVGSYGEHMKAVVEAFVAAARQLLLGATYRIGKRQVPRMAFRLEIIDDFRLDGLAREIYRDLIRYGLFLRDSRGKSVRGTFVPRLYLRRLLLPYCTLALSKRDSVPMKCSTFVQLLLRPDVFKASMVSRPGVGVDGQLSLLSTEVDPAYDDLGEDEGGESE